MKLPTWQPRERQMSERRHYDPPTLWYAVILGSIVIHLSALGMLRLLLTTGLIGTPTATKLIPIDVIAMATPAAGIAPNTKSTTRLPPKTTAKPTNQPVASNNSPQNRQNASTSSQTRKKSQTGTTKQPAANTKKSPASNSSNPSGKLPTNTKPNSSTGTNKPPSKGTNKPPGTTTPNSPSPNKSPTIKPTPNPELGGGFTASAGRLALINETTILHPGNPNYNDELAILLDGNKQLSAEDLKQLGISLNRDLELKVKLVVKTDGKAEVSPDSKVPSVQIVAGTNNQENAEAIANKIVPQLRFKPTKMAGSPVDANYYLPLNIRPAPK